MAYLTKEQVKQIIKSAPEGTTPEGIIRTLHTQGHQLEGYPGDKQSWDETSQEKLLTNRILENPIVKGLETAGEVVRGGGAAIASYGLGALELGQRGGQAIAEAVGMKVPERGESAISDVLVHGGEIGREEWSKQIEQGGTPAKVGEVAGQVGMAVAGTGKAATEAKIKVLGYLEKIKNPVLRTVLSTSSKVAIDAAASGTEQMIEAGKIDEKTGKAIKTGALISSVFNVAAPALSWLSKQVFNTLGSKLSGTPLKAIQLAEEKPIEVLKGMKLASEQGDDAAQHVYDQLDEAVSDSNNAMKELYGQRLDSLEGKLWKTKEGIMYYNTAPEGSSAVWTKSDFSVEGVKNVLNDTLKSYAKRGTEATGKDLIDDLVGVTQSEKNTINEIWEKVNSVEDINPISLLELKQDIRAFEPSGIIDTQGKKKLASIITKIGKNINNYLTETKQIPEVGEMISDYAEQAELLNTLRSELSMNSSKPSTAINAVMNLLKPTSAAKRSAALKALGPETYNAVTTSIAGTLMSSWEPKAFQAMTAMVLGGGIGYSKKGIIGILPGLVAGLAISSPRLVGTAGALGSLSAGAVGTAVEAAAPAIPGISSQLNK